MPTKTWVSTVGVIIGFALATPAWAAPSFGGSAGFRPKISRDGNAISPYNVGPNHSYTDPPAARHQISFTCVEDGGWRTGLLFLNAMTHRHAPRENRVPIQITWADGSVDAIDLMRFNGHYFEDRDTISLDKGKISGRVFMRSEYTPDYKWELTYEFSAFARVAGGRCI